MRSASLAPAFVLAVILACGPARPPAAETPRAGEAAAESGRGVTLIAVDPARAEPSPSPAPGASLPSSGRDEQANAETALPAPPEDFAYGDVDPGSETGLPAWIRPVRQVQPPTVIGTGGVGPRRVGLQAGHWRAADLPEELARLRGTGVGSSGGGRSEEDVAVDLAMRTAALLRGRGIVVDVLPMTVPIDYQADAFVSIHADGDVNGVLRGFKVARSPLSHIPAHDDSLVAWMNAEYALATGFPRDDLHISRRMEYYYAFNNRRYYHAIGTGTPAIIVESGFMTHPADRAILIGNPDRAAAGLANGVLGFLGLKS